MVLVVCERPAERRREDAKGGSAPPRPPQQGSPPPCNAKFPLKREKTGRKTSKVFIIGKDSSLEKKLGQNHSRFPQKWQRFTSICWLRCSTVMVLLVAGGRRGIWWKRIIILNCIVSDGFEIGQIFYVDSYLLGYIWRHKVSFLGLEVLLLIDIA